MRFIISHRKRFFIFLAVCFTVISLSYIRTFVILPNKLTLFEGEEYVYNFKSPFLVSIRADKDGIIKVSNSDFKANGSNYKLSSPLLLKTQKRGTVKLDLRIFGLIPLKTVKVDIMPNKKIVACGNTIGVKLKINGILVLGLTDVQTVDGNKELPAREGGIKPGDFLIEANKTHLDSIEDLVNEINNSGGNTVKLKYKRGNTCYDVDVRPVKDADDKKYHIGLWVRDGTAGIGTLTFYDPETMAFGALGHGITDIDTGTLMPVESGEILESNILGVKKGQQGSPGELKGVFIEDNNRMGVINKNCEHGIYGKIDPQALKLVSDRQYPIALRTQIHQGPASILANIDGRSVQEYSIEIEKVSKQNFSGSKGMVIKITDKRLLDSTGGIVQGMSGSPIIQNGRIIGAVTHVLVNDPSRGYGIYIEWMLKNIEENQKADYAAMNAA